MDPRVRHIVVDAKVTRNWREAYIDCLGGCKMFLLRTGRRVRRGSIANGGQQIGGDRNKTGVSGNSL